MTPAHEESGAQPGKRILIVEDERIIALDLSRALRTMGYAVVGIAASRTEALHDTASLLPDLVLMDIRLADGSDGIAAAASIRATLGTPIVYLSANADPTTIARAIETEPGGYLAKPYNDRTLRSTIEVALRRHRLETEAREDRERLAARMAELEANAERLQAESIVDPLTGLYNRRHLDDVLERQIATAARGGQVGVILLDIDHFKLVNDTWGHVAGDEVLKAIAGVVREQVRVYDIACRYGGEEFVVVAPGASTPQASVLAERLRAAIEELGKHSVGALAGVSASFGVASAEGATASAVEIVRGADMALYAAKQSGRNRVVCA